jgi:hypothetical protein
MIQMEILLVELTIVVLVAVDPRMILTVAAVIPVTGMRLVVVSKEMVKQAYNAAAQVIVILVSTVAV